MKKIFLLLIAIASFTACFDDSGDKSKIIKIGTYANDVDKNLSLTLYRGGGVFKEYTIPANDKIVFEGGDPFILVDSLRGVWADEREFMWGIEARQTFLSTWRYRTYIEERAISVYTFVFTKQMYDAATPINTPAEE